MSPPNRIAPRSDTVVQERTLVSQKPGVRAAPRTYRILRTTQVDAYEPPVTPQLVASGATLAMAPPGDSFKGTARKRAKISIAKATKEQFGDVRDLVSSLASEAQMGGHHPPIGRGANSGRVAEERRNVAVRAWLYAASRENDNDFHLIIGRDPENSAMYMTVEVSGLPPSSSKHRKTLKRARDAYKAFFTNSPNDLPGASYDFYKPPIPVKVEGSLFFDIGHLTGGRPGPEDLRPDIPTVWEIHPVTTIEFEP